MLDFIQSPAFQRGAWVIGGLLAGLFVERFVAERVRRFAEATRIKWDDLILKWVRGLPTIWLATGGLYMALTVEQQELAPWMRAALTVVLIGSLALGGMRLAGGAVEIWSQSMGVRQSPTLVVNLAKLAVMVLAGVLVLENLGIDITPLITALGIGGLAVALALQDTLGNLFAGVHIILSRHVRPRDYIRLASGEEGRVTDVKARNTTIETSSDGSLLAVPNSVLATSIVKNYTLPTPDVWVSVNMGVAYGSDLDRVEQIAREVAREVLASVEGGVSARDPVVMYKDFGTSRIEFVVRVLVRDYDSQGAVRHELIKRLHRRFAAEGIEIPVPVQTTTMKGGLQG